MGSISCVVTESGNSIATSVIVAGRRHIGATGIVKSQSGGYENVEAEAEASEAAAVDALRFRHIGLEVIIRRLVAEVEAATAWIMAQDEGAAICGEVR